MLKLQNVEKAFGETQVLKDISLEVETGKIVSILGASGSGKSTLLNIILGIEQVTGGSLTFDGEDITNVPMKNRPFNIVFQDYALFPNLTAYENLTYGLRNNKHISTKEEVEDFIDLLNLRDHLNKKVHELSGGQKQRVALGRTLVMKPKVLLLDEPLSALDGVIKESIKERIKEISRKYNLTTIIVTHDPEEALTMSDMILILNQGHVAQYATPTDIANRPKDRFVQDFIVNQLLVKRNHINAIFSGADISNYVEAPIDQTEMKVKEAVW
ncbi:ABC transporter ATP-binding protein [Aerococcaceae bacterium 50-4]